MDTTPAIEVSGLTKRYGSFVAISDIDLTVRKGEFMGLLGPTSGTVRIDGIDISDHRRAMEHVGCVIRPPNHILTSHRPRSWTT